MTDALNTTSQALREWVCTAALPFWANTARDDNGGWYEDLDLNAHPRKDVIRRLRVQARQIYVYANATHLGWYDGADIAKDTFDFMTSQGLGRDEAPGFIHLLGPDYTVVNAKRDFYDHTFYLLACASILKLGPYEDKHRALLNIQTMMREDMQSPHGGWAEDRNGTLPRRQNPHMHFLEASMALYDVTQDAQHMEHAAQVMSLFHTHFHSVDTHAICEFFAEDWRPAPYPVGDTAEPGHAAEWVWLLHEYEKRSGVSTQQAAENLYTSLTRPDIFLCDETFADGREKRGTKRLWVQTELVKAHLAQAERGNPRARKNAAHVIDKIMTDYLCVNGTWRDQLDADHTPIATTIPVSTFYHIFCMASEAVRVAEL